MAFVHESLHFLLFCLFLSTCLPSISTTNTTTSLTTSTSKPHRLVSKLIHSNSIHHPLYSPNATTRDQFLLDLKQSIRRLAHIKATLEGSLFSFLPPECRKQCYLDYCIFKSSDRCTPISSFMNKSISSETDDSDMLDFEFVDEE
jgi:hypothetical protein